MSIQGIIKKRIIIFMILLIVIPLSLSLTADYSVYHIYEGIPNSIWNIPLLHIGYNQDDKEFITLIKFNQQFRTLTNAELKINLYKPNNIDLDVDVIAITNWPSTVRYNNQPTYGSVLYSFTITRSRRSYSIPISLDSNVEGLALKATEDWSGNEKIITIDSLQVEEVTCSKQGGTCEYFCERDEDKYDYYCSLGRKCCIEITTTTPTITQVAPTTTVAPTVSAGNCIGTPTITCQIITPEDPTMCAADCGPAFTYDPTTDKCVVKPCSTWNNDPATCGATTTTGIKGCYWIDCNDENDPNFPPECVWDMTRSLINGSCVEAIEGHNNRDEERINLVFVGYNYNNIDIFKSLVNRAINGENEGLFTLEPFKSNINKFNIWYVNEVQYLNILYISDILIVGRTLKKTCNFDNLYGINLYGINLINADAPKGSGERYLSTADFPEDNPSTGVMIHEFGHSFGRLNDEYSMKGSEAPLPAALGKRNCFLAQTKEECLANAPWKDLIGYGCGEKGIVDCLQAPGKPTEEGRKEVSCYEGCAHSYYGIWRPTFASIMKGHDYNTGFGPVNIRFICEEIKRYTGDVEEGICLELLEPPGPTPTTVESCNNNIDDDNDNRIDYCDTIDCSCPSGYGGAPTQPLGCNVCVYCNARRSSIVEGGNVAFDIIYSVGSSQQACQLNFGDGIRDTRSCSVDHYTINHQYTTAGTYNSYITFAGGGPSVSCGTINVIQNQPPTITITSPIHESTMLAGNIGIVVRASDTDGTISSVTITVTDVVEQQIVVTPTNLIYDSEANKWEGTIYLASGTYSLTATATDNRGAIATSQITITVTGAIDTTPPTVLNTVVNPISGLQGTMFTIASYVKDPSGVNSVTAYIQNPDETNVATITLYDDGSHGDVAAGDNIYGNIWDSTGQFEATYYIDIVSDDIVGNSIEIENAASFDIIISNCTSIIYNGASSDKLDVVFVGSGFSSLSNFADVVNNLIDYYGTFDGLMSVEPFASNKNKFNFWRVDTLQTWSGDPRDPNFWANVWIPFARGICPLADELVLLSVEPYVRPGSCVRIISADEVEGCHILQIPIPIFKPGPVLIHEFGHAFGGLADEYVRGTLPTPDSSPYVNCDGATCPKWCPGPSGECTGTVAKDCSREEDPQDCRTFRECSVNSVTYECVKKPCSTWNNDRETCGSSAITGISGCYWQKECIADTSCIEGCNYVNWYRAFENTVMRDQNLNKEYKLINENRLRELLDKYV